MNQYLRSYQVKMVTIGPIFIGNGREIGKKEYVFLNKTKVGIPDAPKLYQELRRRGRAGEFEKYLLGNSRDDLTLWLKKQGIRLEDIRPLMKYSLDCGDAVIERGSRLQVMECMKDSYGFPYIPGSSLKGMFRTLLLGRDIMDRPSKYRAVKSGLRENADVRTGRTNYLKRDISGIEGIAFKTLNREKRGPGDAVNDMLQGFVVSDSEPLPPDSLVLCQKVEMHTDGTGKELPILRECIKPGTEIRYTIAVDGSICPLDDRDILMAVGRFAENYNKNFRVAFHVSGKLQEDEVLLGGGCGFVSKTVVYPLFGKDEGIDIARNVFEKTKVPFSHKHNRDRAYGVSPHILKCTRYQGRVMEMGVCRIVGLEQQ